MRRLVLLLAPLFLAPFLATAVAAAKPETRWHEFKAGEAIVIRPDKAYLLVRTVELFGMRFVRITGDDGAAAARSNFVELMWVNTIDKASPDKVHLIETDPGTLWLYGEKTESWLDGPWLNCLCMGTVRFDAKAGMITDLGTIRDIAYETRGGKRPDRRGVTHVLRGNREERAIVVEPAAADSALPAVLERQTHVVAEYRAAGWLPNIEGTRIDRISTIPGVIGYDRDKVIDLRSGKVLR